MPACPHHLFSSPSLHPSILTQPTSPSSFYFVFFCHRAGISLASTFPCLHHGSDPADFFFFLLLSQATASCWTKPHDHMTSLSSPASKPFAQSLPTYCFSQICSRSFHTHMTLCVKVLKTPFFTPLSSLPYFLPSL